MLSLGSNILLNVPRNNALSCDSESDKAKEEVQQQQQQWSPQQQRKKVQQQSQDFLPGGRRHACYGVGVPISSLRRTVEVGDGRQKTSQSNEAQKL